MTLFLYVSLVFISACSSAPAKSPTGISGAGATPDSSVQSKVWKFIPPDIPLALTTPEAKISYLVEHYWDNFDFRDTVGIRNPEYAEQVLVNYLSVLADADYQALVDAADCMYGLVEKMRQDSMVYAWFDEKLDHYLYDPNSPMRNDGYYKYVLRGMIHSRNYSDMEKIRPRFRLAMLEKNEEGSKAANFSYTLSGGKRSTLYDIRSPYTLLMLYDPECENCRRTMEEMKRSPVIIGDLKVLTVCVENDMDSWVRHLPLLSKDWLNGFDSGGQIREKELYDLRSFPSLYLLDGRKRVLLRDANWNEVADYFMKIAVCN